MLCEKSAADGRARRGVPATRLADLAGERLAQRAGDESRGVEDLLEVDAVLEAARVEEVDEVLGREIANGTGGVGAPTGPARRAVEGPDPFVEGGHDVDECRAA